MSVSFYLHLPISTYLYKHLPTSINICLRLPNSTYILVDRRFLSVSDTRDLLINFNQILKHSLGDTNFSEDAKKSWIAVRMLTISGKSKHIDERLLLFKLRSIGRMVSEYDSD